MQLRRGLRTCEVNPRMGCSLRVVDARPRAANRGDRGHRAVHSAGSDRVLHRRAAAPWRRPARRTRVGHDAALTRLLRPCPSLALVAARGPPATPADAVDPVGTVAAAPDARGGRPGFDPPSTHVGAGPPRRRSARVRGPAGPRRAARHRVVRGHDRRPRRRGGRPRRHPDHLRAGDLGAPRGHDGGRRRRHRRARPCPAPTASHAPACTGAGSAGETYLDPLRLVGARPGAAAAPRRGCRPVDGSPPIRRRTPTGGRWSCRSWPRTTAGGDVVAG